MFKPPAEIREARRPCLRNSAIDKYAGDDKFLSPEARNIDEFNEFIPGNPVVPCCCAIPSHYYPTKATPVKPLFSIRPGTNPISITGF